MIRCLRARRTRSRGAPPLSNSNSAHQIYARRRVATRRTKTATLGRTPKQGVRKWLVRPTPVGYIPNHDSRHGGSEAGASSERSPIRRKILHRSGNNRDLLPPHLPGQHAESSQRPLLPFRSGCRSSRVPALPALPSGIFTGNAGLDGKLGNCVTGIETDSGRRPG
jgi:hypothetical protein